MPGFIGDGVANFFGNIIDSIMKAIWTAALFLLRGAFQLVDKFTVFSLVDAQGNVTGPLAALWPLMRSVSLLVALGLFFWQLTATMLHGGRGFWRATTGPFAYAIAMASTAGVVAAVLVAADGLTGIVLAQGLQAENFGSVVDRGVGGMAIDAIGAVVLGLAAIFGVIPAALGYLLEMIFRQAAITVLVATIPITAAGLLAQTTATWFWRSLRWITAAILMKPVLALVLTIGVAMAGRPEGLAGLLAGVGVLLIALLCPFVLFRLLAFIDPNTDPGGGLRSWFHQTAANLSAAGGSGDTGGGGVLEAANYSRFEQSLTDYASASMRDSGVGAGAGGGLDPDVSGSSAAVSSDVGAAPGSPATAGGDPGVTSGERPPPEHPDVSERPPGPHSPGSSGGGGAAGAAAAAGEDAAVIL